MDGLVGDPDAEVRCARSGALLSRGYERVLLGDHGPYFELDRDRVVWSNLRLVPGGAARFYDEWRVAAPKPSLDDDPDPDPDPTKLYDQLRPVTGQRNPPRDSAWAVANNRPESEGYAEYLPGRVYLGAHRASVAGRAMPQRRVGGRVAWWKPSERRGAIIPDGVVGVRNLATGRTTVGEIIVRADQLADGADALVPGEGVWFDVIEERVRREPEENVGVGVGVGDDGNRSPTVSAVAVAVSGPGDEPTRQLCPGAAEAAAAALAAARLKSVAAAAAKGRGKNPAEVAATRAKLEGGARAEAERAAVAGACRRVARILRENYPRIFARRERATKGVGKGREGNGDACSGREKTRPRFPRGYPRSDAARRRARWGTPPRATRPRARETPPSDAPPRFSSPRRWWSSPPRVWRPSASPRVRFPSRTTTDAKGTRHRATSRVARSTRRSRRAASVRRRSSSRFRRDASSPRSVDASCSPSARHLARWRSSSSHQDRIRRCAMRWRSRARARRERRRSSRRSRSRRWRMTTSGIAGTGTGTDVSDAGIASVLRDCDGARGNGRRGEVGGGGGAGVLLGVRRRDAQEGDVSSTRERGRGCGQGRGRDGGRKRERERERDGTGTGTGREQERDGTSPTPVPSPTPADHLAGMVEKTRLG